MVVFQKGGSLQVGDKILNNNSIVKNYMMNLSKEQINELSKVADEILKGDFNTNSIILNCIKIKLKYYYFFYSNH
jgi:hypothetical protein